MTATIPGVVVIRSFVLYALESTKLKAQLKRSNCSHGRKLLANLFISLPDQQSRVCFCF